MPLGISQQPIRRLRNPPASSALPGSEAPGRCVYPIVRAPGSGRALGRVVAVPVAGESFGVASLRNPRHQCATVCNTPCFTVGFAVGRLWKLLAGGPCGAQAMRSICRPAPQRAVARHLQRQWPAMRVQFRRQTAETTEKVRRTVYVNKARILLPDLGERFPSGRSPLGRGWCGGECVPHGCGYSLAVTGHTIRVPNQPVRLQIGRELQLTRDHCGHCGAAHPRVCTARSMARRPAMCTGALRSKPNWGSGQVDRAGGANEQDRAQCVQPLPIRRHARGGA